MSHRKVLDYHDVLLYADDTELLRGPQWLNDQAGSSSTISVHRISVSLYYIGRIPLVCADYSVLFRVPESRKVWWQEGQLLPRVPNVPPAPLR